VSPGATDYTNVKVIEIREQLGAFDYGNVTSFAGVDQSQLEFRMEMVLENQAKFEG